jgi:hypothetical protein
VRKPSRPWIVVILAYIVGVAGLAHVIAGTAECLFVVFKGGATLRAYLGEFSCRHCSARASTVWRWWRPWPTRSTRPSLDVPYRRV